MNRFVAFTLLIALGAVSVAPAAAQGPPRGPREGQAQGQTATAESFVARLMKFDADADGKLSKSEVTDARLFPLLTRADADGNGTVTKQELAALYAKETAAEASMRRGGPGQRRGPGGFGPPGMGPPSGGAPRGAPPNGEERGPRRPPSQD